MCQRGDINTSVHNELKKVPTFIPSATFVYFCVYTQLVFFNFVDYSEHCCAFNVTSKTSVYVLEDRNYKQPVIA